MSERLAKAVLVLATEAGSYFEDIDKAEKRAKDVEKAFDGTSKSFEQLGKSFQNWGKTLSLSVTAGLAAVSVAAIAAGQEVDDALDTIRAGTGATGKALEGLEDSFREVFRNVPDSAEAVAEAISEIHKRTGQAGPALEQMTTQMLTLARLQKTEVGPLIASTTRLFGDWSIATDKQSSTLDGLFKISQATGLGVNHLAEQVVQFGAPLRQMGFDLETSAALLGKWEKEGVNVELVLGSLRIAAAKFASANIPMREGLESTIAKIQELGPGAKATSLAIEVFGRKAGPDMAAAITEGRFAVADLMKQIEGSQETIMGAAKDTDGFAETWAKLKHEVILALEPLGVSLMNVLQGLMPVLQSGAATVRELSEWFGKLSPSTQTAIIAIGGIAAAAGPAAILLGTVIEKVASLSKAYGVLSSASSALALGGLGPLGLAIAAIGTGFVLAKRDMDAYIDRMEALRQKQAEQQTLLEAYRKITGETRAVMVDFTQLTEEQKAQMIGMAKAANTAAMSNRAVTVSLGEAQAGAKGHTQATKAASAAVGDYDAVLGKLTGDQKAASKATKDHEQETKKLADAIKALGLVTADDLNDELVQMQLGLSSARAAGVPLLNLVAAFTDKLEDLIKRGRASGIEMGRLEEELDQLRGTWRALANLPELPIAKSLEKSLAAISGTSGVKAVVLPDMQAQFAAVQQFLDDQGLGMWHDFNQEVVSENREGAKNSVSQWEQFAKQLGPTILAAAAGGGRAADAIGALIGQQIGESLQKSLQKYLTGRLGEFISDLLPGIGAFIGPLISRGIEWINDRFLGGEGRKVNDLRDEFKEKFGDAAGAGLQAVIEKWNDPALNAAYEKLMRTGKIEDFEKASKELETRLGELEQQAVDTAEAISDALGAVGPATANIVGGFAAKLAPGIKALDDLKKKRDELASDGDTAGADKISAEISAKATQMAVANQGEFDRLSRIALAGFNAFIGQGQTAAEAVSTLVPAIDALKGSADALSFSGNDAYNQLLRWRDLVTENQPLLDQVSGLNELMSALGTLGALDASTFADMQAQGVSAFGELKKAGFSQNEALTQMKPLLEKIVELHDERGLAIDEETQALIDQAREDGILKKKQIDTNAVLMQGLGAVIKALGGEMPKAWTEMGDAAEREAKRVQQALDGIEAPEIEVGVTYRTRNGIPDGGYQGDGASAEPEFRWGTPDLDFASFGRARRAILHNDEAVIPRGRGHELASEIAAAMGNSAGSVRANVYLDKDVLVSALVPALPDEVDRFRVTR